MQSITTKLPRLYPGMDVKTLKRATQGIAVTLSEKDPSFDLQELFDQVSYCKQHFSLTRLHIYLDDNILLLEFYEQFPDLFATIQELCVKFLHYDPGTSFEKMNSGYHMLLSNLKTLVWEEPREVGPYRKPTKGIPIVFAVYAPKLVYANVLFRPVSSYWRPEYHKTLGQFHRNHIRDHTVGSLELVKCVDLKTLHVSLGEASLFRFLLDGYDSIEELTLFEQPCTRVNWTLVFGGMKSLRAIDLVKCDPVVVGEAQQFMTNYLRRNQA